MLGYATRRKHLSKGLEKEGIFIKSYSDLLAEARRYNDDLYKMYEDISMKKNNKSDK